MGRRESPHTNGGIWEGGGAWGRPPPEHCMCIHSRFLSLLFLPIIRRDDMFLFAMKVVERALHIMTAIGVPVANLEGAEQLQ